MKINLIPAMLAASLLVVAVLASGQTKPDTSRTEPNKPSQATPKLDSQAPETERATARLVWSGSLLSDFRNGAVSPDSRYLAYVHWNTGDHVIQEIATGKRRPSTYKEG